MTEWDFLLVPYGGQSALSDLQLRVLLSRKSSGAPLEFQFALSGPGQQVEQVMWPKAISSAARKDGLWQTTCCEIFVGSKLSKAYFEINLSPSGDWNVYAFDDYRSGIAPVSEISSPFVSRETHGLRGSVDISQLVGPDGVGVRSEQDGDIVVGITAVLEYKTGEKEYWALTHKGEKPDFHLRSSFSASI